MLPPRLKQNSSNMSRLFSIKRTTITTTTASASAVFMLANLFIVSRFIEFQTISCMKLNQTSTDQFATTSSAQVLATNTFQTSHIRPLARLQQQHAETGVGNNNNNDRSSSAPTSAISIQAPRSTTSNNRTTPPRLIASSQSSPLLNAPSQVASNHTSSSLANVRLRWRQMEFALGQSIDLFGQELRLTLDAILQDKRTTSPNSQLFVTNQCRLALDELVAGLMEHQLWATRMLDSSAFRLPVGLLEGTLTDLGNFDECLAISNHRPPANRELASAAAGGLKFKGQYCSLLIKPPLIQRPRLHTACRRLPALSSSSSSSTFNQTTTTLGLILSQNSHQFYYAGLRLGLCLPSKCSQTDLQHLFTIYLNKYELSGQLKSCQQQQQSQGGTTTLGPNNNSIADFVLGLDLVQKSILISFIIILLLNLIGTLLDSRHTAKQRRQQALINLLLANSLRDHHLHRHKPHAFTGPAANEPQPQHDDETNSNDLLFQHNKAANKRNKAKKEWNYQVYCGSELTCLSSNADESSAKEDSKRTKLSSSSTSSSSSTPTSTSSLEGGMTSNHNNTDELELDAENSIGLQVNPLSEDYIRNIQLAHSVANHPQTAKHRTAKKDVLLTERRNSPSKVIAAPQSNKGSAAIDGGDTHHQADVPLLLSDLRNQAEANFDVEPKMPNNNYRDCFTCRNSFKQHLKSTLVCFSLTNNLRSIGKFSSSSSASHLESSANTRDGSCESMTDIKVIHGLRTFSMIWIIFGHTIGLVNPEMMNNLFPLASLSCSSRLLQALLNATLAVNTFFMISGLVTVISFARKCKSARELIFMKQQQLVDDDLDRDNNNIAATRTGTVDNDADDARGVVINTSGTSSQPPMVIKARLSHGQSATGGSDFEVSSVDSANSVITTLSSSTSSNRNCIGNHQSKSVEKLLSSTNSNGDERQKSLAATATTATLPTKQTSAPYWPSDFQPLIWLLLRYLRLTPTYATIIGVSILMPQLGSGPFWPETIQPLGQNCRSNWWLNLFYVNNFLETDKLCLIHSWYLSNDWQFFLLALFLFATFYRSKKLALLLCATACLASSAMTFVVTVANDFPPTIVTTSPAVAERWLFIHSLYYKPWPHVSSYLVGLLAGYLILIRDRVQLGPGWRLACWLLFTLIALAVLNSIYPWNMGLQVDPTLTGLHSATFRTLWSCCCAWLVFALVTRPRHPLALFLSWRGFQFTSRLTYCAYLVHPLIIYYNFGVLRERLDSSIYGQLNRFMATLLMSYLFALLLSLLVESPSIQFQQMLVNCWQKKKDKKGVGDTRTMGAQIDHHHLLTKLNGKYNYASPSSATNNGSESENTTTTWTSQDSSAEQQLLANSLLASSESFKFLSRNGNLIENLKQRHHHQAEDQLLMNNNKSSSASNSCCLHSSSSPPSDHHHHHQHGKKDRRLSENSSTTSALDEEFQRKLAQAIGRGFRIRSKIANHGTIKTSQSSSNNQMKRFGPTKRFPASINQQRASLPPLFNEGGKKDTDNKSSILKSTINRRSDSCSTFVPLATNNDEGLKATSFVSPTVDHHHNQQQQTCDIKPMQLNEMLQLGRQKLHTPRSQKNPATKINHL